MGSFSAKLQVWNPTTPARAEEVEAMVDAGAAFSWIHRERIERLGAQVLRRRLNYRTGYCGGVGREQWIYGA